MNDEFEVTRPYCGEQVEIYLEPDMKGTFVQDCEVCCNPWRVRVFGSGGGSGGSRFLLNPGFEDNNVTARESGAR